MASKTLAIAALLAAVGAGPAIRAQEAAAPKCTAAAVLPAELAGWSKRTRVAAAAGAKGLAAATIVPGAAVEAALLPTPKVSYAVQPEKPGGSVSYGGLVGFAVPTAGTYRVALDSGAWIDVLAGGKPVISSGHGHGPACSDIRKMVDFPLAAGPHVLQIAASGKPAVVVLVARVP